LKGLEPLRRPGFGAQGAETVEPLLHAFECSTWHARILGQIDMAAMLDGNGVEIVEQAACAVRPGKVDGERITLAREGKAAAPFTEPFENG
jgi:hypothetical protein